MSNFTDVRLTLLDKDSLRALCTVKAAGIVFLSGMRVVQGKNGLFVSMPSHKNAKGEYKDIYFPASKEVREELQELVLGAYYEALAKQTDTTTKEEGQ